MSLDGKAFTYDNQLASSPTHLSKREEWFECACCPPNVSRVLGYLGGYIWTLTQTHLKSVDISTHLYTSATLSSEVDGKQIQLTQQTDWPWSGDIHFEVAGAEEVEMTVRLRIPQWAESFEVKLLSILIKRCVRKEANAINHQPTDNTSSVSLLR